MIRSMTAYGRAKSESADLTLTVEIKSVNSRYLDISVRLPRAYSYLEEKVKGYVQNNIISRGKVEVNITYEHHTSDVGAIRLDEAFTASYVAALLNLRDRFNLPDDISVMHVARTPEVFTYERTDVSPEDAWARLSEVLTAAGNDYTEMRIREGNRTEEDISSRLETVAQHADEVEAISRRDTVGYRDKLESRIRTILADNSLTIDENRILTECAIWADKIAIDEELVRLRSHFTAFRDICREATPSGKKLDFLMQELNRETNTIGSKANNAEIARHVVTMKNELEKIREQVQNIE